MEETPPPSRARRALRVILVGAALSSGVVGGGVVGLVLALRTDAGNRLIAGVVQTQVSGLMDGELALGGLETDLFSYVVVRDLRMSDGQGQPVIEAGWVELRYDLWALLWGEVHVTKAHLVDVDVDLVTSEDGTLNIVGIFASDTPAPVDPDAEPWAGLPVDIVVDELLLEPGRFRFRTTTDGEVSDVVHLDEIGLEASFVGSGKRYALDVTRLDLQMHAPLSDPIHAEGTVVWDDMGLGQSDLLASMGGVELRAKGEWPDLVGEGSADFDVQVHSLDLETVDGWAGEPGLQGNFEGDLRVEGSLNDLSVAGSLDGQGDTQGGVDMELHADVLGDPLTYGGTVRLRDVHANDVYPGLGDDMQLDGTLTVEGEGTSWPDGVKVKATYEGEKQLIQGVELDSLSAEVRLEEGKLELDRVDASGPLLGEAEATGSIDLISGHMAIDVTADVNPQVARVFGVPEELMGSGRTSTHIGGELYGDEVQIAVSGRLVLAPFVYGPDVRARRLVANYRTNVVGGRVDLSVDATLDDLVAYGVAVQLVQADKVVVRVSEQGMHLEAPVQLEYIAYQDQVTVAGAAGRAVIEVPNHGPLDIQLDLGVRRVDLRGLEANLGMVRAQIEGDDLKFNVELQAGDREFLSTAGQVDLAALSGSLNHFRFAPTPRQAWSDDGATRFTVAGSGVTDTHLALSSELGALEFQGTAGLTGPLDATITIDKFELDAIAELVPDVAAGLAGRVSLLADLKGTAKEPVVKAGVDIKGLWVQDAVQWLDMSGRVEAEEGELDVALKVGVAGERLAKVEGTIPAYLDFEAPGLRPDGQTDLELTLLPGPHTRFEWLVPDTALPQGQGSAHLTLSGALDDPVIDLAAVATLAVPGWVQPARAEIKIKRDGSELDWWMDLLEGYRGRAILTGGAQTRLREVIQGALGTGPVVDLQDYGLYAHDIDTTLTVNGFPLASAARVAGIPLDLGGHLFGTVGLRGSAMRPEVSADLQIQEGRLGEVKVHEARVALRPREDGLELDMGLAFSESHAVKRELVTNDLGTVRVAGIVPLKVDLTKPSSEWAVGELDLTIGGDGVPLSLANGLELGISQAEGAMKVDGTVTGPLFAPVPELALLTRDATMVYEPLGVRYSKMDLDLKVSPEAIVLERFHAATSQRRASLAGMRAADKSFADAKGRIELTDWAPQAVDVRVELSQILLASGQDLTARVSTRDLPLTVLGVYPELEVRGDIKVDHFDLFLDLARVAGASPLAIDNRVKVHRPGQTTPEPAEEVPSLIEDLDVALSVDLGRNINSRVVMPLSGMGPIGQVDVRARLGGDIDFTMQNSVPNAVGQVEVLDGSAKLLQGRFELQSSLITFTGDDIAEPLLEIKGEMDMQGSTIDLLIGGTPSNISIDLTSEDYPDLSQIIMIVATGKTPEEMNEGEASSLVSSMLASAAITALFGSANVGSLNVEPDGRVSYGLPAGNSVWIETIFDPKYRLDQNSFSASAQWSVSRGVVAEVGIGDVKSWFNFFLERKF